MTKRTFHVSSSVSCESESEAVSVVEVLSRAMIGLALEGKTAQLTVVTIEDDDD